MGRSPPSAPLCICPLTLCRHALHTSPLLLEFVCHRFTEQHGERGCVARHSFTRVSGGHFDFSVKDGGNKQFMLHIPYVVCWLFSFIQDDAVKEIGVTK